MTEWPDIIQIDIERGISGTVFATSPNLPGFHMAEKTHEELLRKLPVILKLLVENSTYVRAGE